MELISEVRVTSLDPVFGPMGVEAGRAIWAAPELTMREKASLLIAADLCVPELGLPFELHIGMALGPAQMAVEDLRELLRHIAPDAGFNIVAMGFQRMAEIARQLGFEPSSQATGVEAGEQIYAPSSLAALSALDTGFADHVDQASRKLWNRSGLSVRERCLATFAVDVIGGTLGAPFKAHLEICRRAGLARQELHAALRMLAEFSTPKAWQALIALDAIFRTHASVAIDTKGFPMSSPDDAAHLTTHAQVAVTKYIREVLDHVDDSVISVVETRLEEQFSGGLTGIGLATHLRLEHPDGSGILTCLERITGELDGRSGSFLLKAEGFTDHRHQVHGRWEVIGDSGTGELHGLRGYAAFSAVPDQHSKTGWVAETSLTYWFDGP